MKFKKGIPPHSQDMYLAKLSNYPTPTLIYWSVIEKAWCMAELQLNMVEGEWNDPYFDTSWCDDKDILEWVKL